MDWNTKKAPAHKLLFIFHCMKQTDFKIKDDTKKRGVCMEKESFDIAYLSPDLLKQIHLLEEQLGERDRERKLS